jgi:hypothetical protein
LNMFNSAPSTIQQRLAKNAPTTEAFLRAYATIPGKCSHSPFIMQRPNQIGVTHYTPTMKLVERSGTIVW